MKPKHQRLVFIAITVLFVCFAALLAMSAFRDSIVFFYTPSELSEKKPAAAARIRLGGMVEQGSLRHEGNDRITFRLTDGAEDIEVGYTGMLPPLFREGQGAVVEGSLKDGHFEAARVLTKHDERYMPREVVESLKRSGRWYDGAGAQ